MLSNRSKKAAKSEADKYLHLADVLYVTCEIQQDRAIVTARFMNGAIISTEYDESDAE